MTPKYQGKPFTYFETLQDAEEYEGSEFCIAEMPDNSWFSYQDKNYRIKSFDSENQMMICQDEDGIIIEIDSSKNALYLGSFTSKL